MARPQAHPRPGRTHPLPVRPHHPGGLGTLQEMPPPYRQGHASGLVPGRNSTTTRRLANPQPRTPGHRTPLQGAPCQGSHHERGGDTGPTPTPGQTRGKPHGGSSAPPARSGPQSSGPNGTPQAPPVNTRGTTHRPHHQGTHAASHPLNGLASHKRRRSVQKSVSSITMPCMTQTSTNPLRAPHTPPFSICRPPRHHQSTPKPTSHPRGHPAQPSPDEPNQGQPYVDVDAQDPGDPPSPPPPEPEHPPLT